MTPPVDDADPNRSYLLGHSDRELARLKAQACLIDPITRQFFRDAGLAPGMRVRSSRPARTDLGALYFWNDRVLYLGHGLPAVVHAHHAVQVCLPLVGAVRLRCGPSVPWRSYEGAVIPSNQPHESDVAVDALAAIWIEPTTSEARGLLARRTGPGIAGFDRSRLGALLPELRACSAERWSADRAAALLERVLRALAPTVATAAPTADTRVARVAQIIDAEVEQRPSVPELAAAVSLSPSRLQHLFAAEVGIPIRRYALWSRLRRAARELARGSSVTRAAHAAGFADSAHLSRTFRRTLGFTPSSALHLEVSRFVQASAPLPR